MRLLLPRRRRGRGLGGLTRRGGAAALTVALLVSGCGGSSPPPRPTPTPTRSAAPTATPAPVREPALAVGITEPNPNFVRPSGSAPSTARWRDALAAMHPAYYRLVIDWGQIQPVAANPADLTVPQTGCARSTGPCVGWQGIVDQLRALAARQRQGGWRALVVITDTPAWAATPVAGCTEDAAGARSSSVRPSALPAYRTLVERVLAAAHFAGAELRFWSPWNEPNHPFFFPQRTACDATAPTRAPAAYVPLARTLRAALDADIEPHELALGELAGVREPSGRATSIGEFISALPRDVVCSADVWTQHAYIGGSDPVDIVTDALRARGCPGGVPPIWITETGVGGADSRLSIARGITSESEGCRLLHQQLVDWWRDPRVAAAFQYTLRDDPAFPTGLVSADLAHGRPTFAEWRAWGERPRPDDPPPPSAC